MVSAHRTQDGDTVFVVTEVVMRAPAVSDRAMTGAARLLPGRRGGSKPPGAQVGNRWGNAGGTQRVEAGACGKGLTGSER